MQNEDKQKFLEIMNGCASAYRQVIEKPVIAIFWKLLAAYEIGEVEKAFLMHIRAKTFFPNPAEILAVLDAKSKRLSADEAWSMMPNDESETVVWTDEMAEAYRIASELLADGDKIAARMAFKAAYERLCAEAVMLQKPVVWKASIGYDKASIEPVLQAAVLQGRISAEDMAKRLPAPMDGGFIGKLLTGKVTDLPDNEKNLKARWAGLKQALVDGNQRMEEMAEQERVEARLKQVEFEKRRQDAISFSCLQQKH